METVTTVFESTDLRTAARMFHALGDETRLRILINLRDGECCVCELTDACDAAQSRLSYHLRILKEAGILSDRREGRWSYYCIEPAAEEMASNLVRLFTAPCGEAGCCSPEDSPGEREHPNHRPKRKRERDESGYRRARS